MPRRPRSYIPGLPYHIVQRGNNRQACFMKTRDYLDYLDLWQSCSNRYKVRVHAYCLMTNHIHFLVTPECDTSISNTMKVVGSRYAQLINRRYKRTGSLWEGRHKSSLIDSDSYLLCCYQYIELNPVRAKIVRNPGEYPWSSYLQNSGLSKGWITQHPTYLGLGESDSARQKTYRRFVKLGLSKEKLNLIRKAAHFCQPVGNENFKYRIEAEYGVKVGYMKRGRPKKPSA